MRRQLPDLPLTDLSEPVMFSDPFPRYAELRRTAPVSLAIHRESRRVTAYMLTRHRDVMTLHTDPRFSSDPIGQSPVAASVVRHLPRSLRLLSESMVYKDDPDHKRLRALVNKAFTPKRVAQMIDDVQVIVDELVSDLAAKGTVELVDDFAVKLPLAVIARMMGVRPAERDAFRIEVERFVDHFAGSRLDVVRALPAAQRLVKFFERLTRDRRAEPDDGLISALLAARDGDDALSENEIISMIFLLLLGGHDTTLNLIGSSVLTLLDHPDELERLRHDPSLDERAVEELMRFTAPVTCGVTRTMLDDIEFSGVLIPKGASVVGMIISANRDEDVFERSEELDLGRTPNHHIGFGFGGHYCLGNQLARLDTRIALRALLDRFPKIELAVPRDRLRWRPVESMRGLQTLPLTLR